MDQRATRTRQPSANREELDRKAAALDEPVVLVVDAARDDGRGAGEAFEGEIRCMHAFDETQALGMALAHRPDLVVVGELLPATAAEALIRSLRQTPAFGDIPVLVLLEEDDPALRVRMLQLGASDCVGAPVHTEEIRLRARRLMNCREAERDLRDSNRQLRRTVANLREFTSVASHDLQAPLRGIANLATWLHDDLGETELPQDSRRHLDLLRDRVARMQQMLGGLLDYARCDHNAEPEEIETDALFEAVIELAEVPSGFRIVHEGVRPPIHAARVPLTQVLLNLVNNAVKHHDRDDGRITLGLDDAGDRWCFAVADDGPGIPEAFRGRMYDLFATRRSWDQAHGNGLGLAIVKKTVQEAGGEIGMEESQGGGARFWFTWPK